MSANLLRILSLVYFVSVTFVHGENSNDAALPAVAANKMTVSELDLNEEDIEQLKRFDEQIDQMSPSAIESSEREAKSFKDSSLRQAAEALTDEEITQIIKSISFPNEEDIMEDNEGHREAASALPDEVEPRTNGQRQGRGYYIVAFTPEEDTNDVDSVPYARLQIIPAERSVDGGSDLSPSSRMVSRKSWNKYLNRLMRQIRRGTRKIQRRTRVKTIKKEPTLENFLKDMYKISQKRGTKRTKKKNSSWFLW